MTQQTMRNKSEGWTSREIKLIREMSGQPVELIALKLDRTLAAVRATAYRNRISLRLKGSRRGLVLGQPRGTSMVAARDVALKLSALREVRQAIVRGELDPADVERAVARRWAVARGVPLCPRCAINPQEQKQTGLCSDCHLRELAKAHQDRAWESAARREYAAAKQASSRAARAVAGSNSTEGEAEE